MKVLARFPSAAGARPASGRPVLRATAVTAGCLVAVGLVGTLGMRHFGGVPFSVPSWPWYYSWPSYLFWQPALDLRAALAGGPAAWAAPLAFVGEYPGAVGQVGPIPAFLGEFPARVPTLPDFAAQHPPFATVFYALVDRVWAGLDAAALATVAAGCLGLLVAAGLARDELGDHGERVAVLCWALAPVTVLYLATSADAMWAPVLAGSVLAADRGLQRRSWGWTVAGGVLLWLASMLTFAAALATVAAGCLGLLVAAGLARDELGEQGERVAVVCWALAPVTVLYVATSADAMWAPVLAGAALAADRGLQRRSMGWTVAGGVLLWLASMLSFAAALVLPFLAVRALAVRAAAGWGWVLRWAAVTGAVVLALAGLLMITTGYDVRAAVAAVDDFWRHAPGTTQRVWWVWIFGDLVAFAAILGFPLAAALVTRLVAAVRERAWGSFEMATGAALLAAACWGHTRGEVERMWQFLVPFAVVVAVRQLLRWRASLPLVAALLLGQALAIQVLFYTRW
ncbi:MAG: hypothetical protein ABW222_08065 [Actinomycetota bacterium]